MNKLYVLLVGFLSLFASFSTLPVAEAAPAPLPRRPKVTRCLPVGEWGKKGFGNRRLSGEKDNDGRMYALLDDQVGRRISYYIEFSLDGTFKTEIFDKKYTGTWSCLGTPGSFKLKLKVRGQFDIVLTQSAATLTSSLEDLKSQVLVFAGALADEEGKVDASALSQALDEAFFVSSEQEDSVDADVETEVIGESCSMPYDDSGLISDLSADFSQDDPRENASDAGLISPAGGEIFIVPSDVADGAADEAEVAPVLDLGSADASASPVGPEDATMGGDVLEEGQQFDADQHDSAPQPIPLYIRTEMVGGKVPDHAVAR